MATTKRPAASPTKHAKTSTAKSTTTTKATPAEKASESKPAKKVEAPNTVAAPTKTTIAYEQIAQRAYQLWQQRGCAHGSHEQDWLTAEKQLRAEA